jgi:hypothetical protein
MAQDGIDDDSGGLFNISISDSEGEDGGIDTSHGIASSSKKEHRTGQSEEAFRAVKSGYRAKVENGEVSQQAGSSDIRCGAFGFCYFDMRTSWQQNLTHALLQIWKSVDVPPGRRRVLKHEAQELLHAVEELYFFRRFEEAVSLVGRIFEGEGGGDGLDGDVRGLLRTYENKCNEKLGR